MSKFCLAGFSIFGPVCMSCDDESLNRVTTCLENLEMSGNLEHVREMSGMLLTVRELSGEKSCHGKCPKTVHY